MTIENPSLLKKSMTFSTERDLFDCYFSMLDSVNFRQETELSVDVVENILKNKEKDVLYTNI